MTLVWSVSSHFSLAFFGGANLAKSGQTSNIYDGLSEIGMGLGLALVYCCCIYHYEMGAEWLMELNSED